MSTKDDDAFEAALQGMRPMLRVAFESGRATGRQEGFAQGVATGEVLGYIQAVNALKPALSDGLRCGSSECGRAMQGLKNLGLDEEDESDL